MDKYTSLRKDIYSIFASSTWNLELINVIPNNVTQQAGLKEFVKMNIITGNQKANSLNSVSGVLIMDIFIEAGESPVRGYYIGDRLDKYLAGKSVNSTGNGTTQFLSSTLQEVGADKVNPALYRLKFSIPFNYFGV